MNGRCRFLVCDIIYILLLIYSRHVRGPMDQTQKKIDTKHPLFFFQVSHPCSGELRAHPWKQGIPIIASCTIWTDPPSRA